MLGGVWPAQLPGHGHYLCFDAEKTLTTSPCRNDLARGEEVLRTSLSVRQAQDHHKVVVIFCRAATQFTCSRRLSYDKTRHQMECVLTAVLVHKLEHMYIS